MISHVTGLTLEELCMELKEGKIRPIDALKAYQVKVNGLIFILVKWRTKYTCIRLPLTLLKKQLLLVCTFHFVIGRLKLSKDLLDCEIIIL